MAKVDNEAGAATSLHVSPTVAAGGVLPVDNVGDIYEQATDGDVLPSAAGADGTPELRQSPAYQH